MLSDSIAVFHASSVLPTGEMVNAKSLLTIRKLKELQTECLASVNSDDYVTVVQPTGSGKLVCFILHA